MPTTREVLECKRCGRGTLHVVGRIDHLLHLVLTLATGGLWLLVWVALGAGAGEPPACTECGKMRGVLGLW